VPAEKDSASDPKLPWYDASKGPLQVGDARVQIGHVLVGPVRMQGILGQEETPDPYLGIQLFIQNGGKTRKIDYPGRSRRSPADVRLVDNFGNIYRRRDPDPLSQVLGQVRETKSIHPGERLEDLLVFEKPLPNVQSLRLELPASAVGGSGTFRFQIPKNMIGR